MKHFIAQPLCRFVCSIIAIDIDDAAYWRCATLLFASDIGLFNFAALFAFFIVQTKMFHVKHHAERVRQIVSRETFVKAVFSE